MANDLSPIPGVTQAQQAPASAGPTTLNPASAAPHAQMVNNLSDQHMAARAQFGQMSEIMSKSDAVRRELASLAQLGDMVTPDDVIKGAGRLVAAGLDPKMLAGLMADMPEGGQALASWVSSHAANAAETEARMMPQFQAMRHTLGLTALKLLTAEHLSQGFEQSGGASPNPLSAQAPGALSAGTPTQGNA